MPFIGKWTLAAPDGSVLVADPKTGQLQIGAATQPQQHFNAYGTPAGFILQAAGGKYVALSGSSYAATLTRDGALTWFAIEDAGGGSVRVVDLGANGAGTPQYYWLDAKGALGRTQKISPAPAETTFTRTVVTPGVADILAGRLPNPADLSWVYLGAIDLTSAMSLTSADLTGANLAGAELGGLTFISATLSAADLSGAKLGGMTDLSHAVLDGTDLTGADLSGAVMNNVTGKETILNGATLNGVTLNEGTLPGAKAAEADFSGFGTEVTSVDFTGADLTDAKFGLATVRTITLVDADLTGADLGNPEKNPSIDLSDSKLSAATNFTSAKLQRVDLRNHDLSNMVLAHADLTGSKLDNTKLIGTELSYADLTGVTLTGNLAMFGANFSNAILTGANLAGAQMGSVSMLFRVVNDSKGAQDYAAFHTALVNDNVTDVAEAFKANKVTLTAPIAVLASPFASDRVWTVTAAGQAYTVRLETVLGTDSLAAYQPSTAAILTNAYMKDAVLTSANLFNVRASGVQLYGNAKLDGQALLEGGQFDGANLSGINLKQARLHGVNFGHATLTGAQLDGAWLTPDGNGGQTSFANANLQGATFADAKLQDAILTDAAVAVARGDGSNDVDGVWLFSDSTPEPLLAQLAAGSKLTTLDARFANQLVQGPVPDPVRAALAKQGIKLAAEALITVQGTGPLWTIADGQTTYRLFHACDTDQYTPALGVSKGPLLVAAFTIPLYLAGALKSGPVPDAVRTAFTAAKVTLGQGATVTAGSMNTDWQFVDTSASYDAWLGLDLDCNLTITVRPAIPGVLDLFASHSLPLTRRATVSAAGSGRWAIDNDSNNPFNPITNYIKCNVSHDASDDTLDVYGSMLRVQRVAPGGTQTYTNILVKATGISQDDLQPSTVCPNSGRTKVNVAEKLPFKQWMRARELPKPPYCVPSADGAFFCPPSGPGRDPR